MEYYSRSNGRKPDRFGKKAMTEEPTVLDYVKALLTPWKGPPPPIPGKPEPASLPKPALPEVVQEDHPSLSAEPLSEIPVIAQSNETINEQIKSVLPVLDKPAETPSMTVEAQTKNAPWRLGLALVLAFLAQFSLNPAPDRDWKFGVALYLAAIGMLVWAYLRGELVVAASSQPEWKDDPQTVRSVPLIAGLVAGIVAFSAFGGNRFTNFNVTLWVISIGLIVVALWSNQSHEKQSKERSERWQVDFSNPRLWLFGLVIITAVFFRFYQLNQVPPEMNSDHAEKLQDVFDILQGERPIFFPRNTGREAIQFYLTAAIDTIFGTGLSHLSLKLGTALAGLLALPFIYLTGKEIASWRAGLLAAFFAGIAYWPNVISRVGLRFPLYPLFVAPALYFLIRGLRRGTRNDFIWSGIALGIGLHGYTPIRILPFAILTAVALFWLHTRSSSQRKQAVWGLLILAFVSLICFLPLLRFALENPSLFGYRAFSRVTDMDQSLPGPAGIIFLDNLWRALTMFAWDNGEIWVVSLPHRPALDLVSAALFHLGIGMLLVRWLRKRQWLDLFLLISIPILMLPSILSLAFPAENPALNRASGAMVPVFLVIGLAADSFITSLGNSGSTAPKRWWLNLVGIGLLLISIGINYALVFNQYYELYAQSAWNTSEMGEVVESFATTIGSPETTWVMAYPHWVDTRLVGIQAGQDTRDMAMSIDRLEDTRQDPRPKLFLVNPLDIDGLDALQHTYPKGWVHEFTSAYENKNFLLYFVPPGE